jgi:hypothetical protein
VGWRELVRVCRSSERRERHVVDALHRNATATVLGESRTVAVSSDSLTDSFADGNAVHIYRIDGGSHCGLS